MEQSCEYDPCRLINLSFSNRSIDQPNDHNKQLATWRGFLRYKECFLYNLYNLYHLQVLLSFKKFNLLDAGTNGDCSDAGDYVEVC